MPGISFVIGTSCARWTCCIRHQKCWPADSHSMQNTAVLYKLCLPETTRLWNNLEQETRNAPTMASFKAKLSLKYNAVQPPKWFTTGNRKNNIIHTRLRNNVSDLNADLYKHKLAESPLCQCGHGEESAGHYFFDCILYTAQRAILINNLSHISNQLNLDIILYGNAELSFGDNTDIATCVQMFIKSTKRFY